MSFNSGNKEVVFRYGSGREQRGTLVEIKYVKLNMMVI